MTLTGFSSPSLSRYHAIFGFVERTVLKIVIFLSISLSGLGGLCFGDTSQKATLEIDGLKDTYEANEPIEFKLKRTVNGPVRFACAAEIFVRGKFEERRWDIFQSAAKVAFRAPKEIKSEVVNEKWDIPNQLPAIRPRAGDVYRLRIDVLSPATQKIYSTPFRITKSVQR